MLERWNPVAEMNRVLQDMDRFLSETTGRTPFGTRVWTYRPPIDLYDTGEQFVLRAVIPGATPDSIDISLEQATLTIRGAFGYAPSEGEARSVTWYRREIGQGQFAESFRLPVPVDADHVQATFENGILTLTMPKAEQAKAKRISVQAPHALTGSPN